MKKRKGLKRKKAETLLTDVVEWVVMLLAAVVVLWLGWTLAAISNPACADDGSIQLHTASKHSDGCDTCNERNYGFGYVGSTEGLTYTVGYYRNSHFNDSWYAGTTYNFNPYLKATVAGVTGYEEDVLPLIFLSYRPLKGDTSPVISLAPTTDGAVVLLSVDFKIGSK